MTTVTQMYEKGKQVTVQRSWKTEVKVKYGLLFHFYICTNVRIDLPFG